MSQKTPAWIRIFLHGNLADDKFTDISHAAVDSFAPPTDRQCAQRAVIKMQIRPCLATDRSPMTTKVNGLIVRSTSGDKAPLQ